MKTVSFNVAKALKEAGYPQERIYGNSNFTKQGVGGSPLFEDGYVAPTYIDVWLWLWREKKIRILFDDDYVEIPDYSYCEFQKDYTDPESAIIAAIEYLVENNLIPTKDMNRKGGDIGVDTEWQISDDELDRLANEYVGNYGCEHYDDGVEAYKAGFNKALGLVISRFLNNIQKYQSNKI